MAIFSRGQELRRTVMLVLHGTGAPYVMPVSAGPDAPQRTVEAMYVLNRYHAPLSPTRSAHGGVGALTT